MTTETRPKAKLDRRGVLEVALEVVDEEGLAALTMRRLATELDVDPMTIHHHVKGKESLLDGVAELLWEEVDLPGSSQDARAVLRTLAHSVRGLFQRHPEAAPLVLRYTRLSLTELRVWRAYLDALAGAGLDQSAAVFRSVLSYALGSGYAENAMISMACDPTSSRRYTDRELLLQLGQSLPPGTPPELASAAAEVIADCDADRCFSDGLELMLAGLTTSSLGDSTRQPS